MVAGTLTKCYKLIYYNHDPDFFVVVGIFSFWKNASTHLINVLHLVFNYRMNVPTCRLLTGTHTSLL